LCLVQARSHGTIRKQWPPNIFCSPPNCIVPKKFVWNYNNNKTLPPPTNVFCFPKPRSLTTGLAWLPDTLISFACLIFARTSCDRIPSLLTQFFNLTLFGSRDAVSRWRIQHSLRRCFRPSMTCGLFRCDRQCVVSAGWKNADTNQFEPDQVCAFQSSRNRAIERSPPERPQHRAQGSPGERSRRSCCYRNQGNAWAVTEVNDCAGRVLHCSDAQLTYAAILR